MPTFEIQHVALLGLMGAGKSSVGRELSSKLGWPLSDSDEVIEREQGATVRELGERIGVTAMHGLEAAHLITALGDPSPSVVCAAASVIEEPSCRQALSRPEVFAVWLEVDPRQLASRFTSGSHRPLFDPDVERMFQTQLRERSRLFAQVADYRLPSDGGDPAGTAAQVAEQLAAAVAAARAR